MVRKGNDKLRATINRALEDMEKDGIQQGLFFEWFGDDHPKG
jgi:ABC-type amino acid transport substrate-binding protein